MGTTYAAELAKIGESLSTDAKIVVHGSDFGTGEAGAGAADTLAKLTGADVVHADAVPDTGVHARNEVVFLDISVPDYQTLLAGIDKPDARIVLIDGSRDAIDQMADYLDGQSGIDAIHIISHGSAGNLILSGQTYSAETLAREYATDLARIGHALTADGDILLYGCDIGKGSAGERFMQTVAEMTGGRHRGFRRQDRRRGSGRQLDPRGPDRADRRCCRDFAAAHAV